MAAVELERVKAAVDIGVTKMVNEPNTHVEARKRNRQATNSTISSCDMAESCRDAASGTERSSVSSLVSSSVEKEMLLRAGVVYAKGTRRRKSCTRE
jgi:hypothetical protein